MILFFFVNVALACEVREESLRTHLDMPYVAILPKGFNPQRKYDVVYFLHGRGGDRHSLIGLGICDELDRLKTPFIVIAPEGKLSYWMNGALTHERWGDMVTSDLRLDVERKFPVTKKRVIAGISMGGHGAVQLSLNYPGIYRAIGAHSPVFRTEDEAGKDFYYEFGTGADYKARDPLSLMASGKKITTPIYIDMGGQDEWLARTKIFQGLIQSQRVQGEFKVGSDAVGGHADGYWKYHLRSYLEWYSKQLLIAF